MSSFKTIKAQQSASKVSFAPQRSTKEVDSPIKCDSPQKFLGQRSSLALGRTYSTAAGPGRSFTGLDRGCLRQPGIATNLAPLKPFCTQKTYKPSKRTTTIMKTKLGLDSKQEIADFHADDVPEFKLNVIVNKNLQLDEHGWPTPPKTEVVKHCFDKVHHRIKQKRLENDWKHNRFHLIPKIEKVQERGASTEKPKTGRSKSKSPHRGTPSTKKKKKKAVPRASESS